MSGRLPVVAIDGPAGAGKSTVGKSLARRLGFQYMDTGALYRTVGLAARRAGIDPSDGPAVARLCAGLDIAMSGPPEAIAVRLNGEDVSSLIRGEQGGELASRVSAHAEVRKALLPIQRRMGEAGGVVMDGRDIGTVVFPDAEVKVYLDASLPVRAARRMAETQHPGPLAAVIEEIRTRDTRDSTREFAPLRQAPDALFLDSTGLTVESVVDTILERFPGLAGGGRR